MAKIRTPSEMKMRSAMSARLRLMLKKHPHINTYYKLEAATNVSNTCTYNIRNGHKPSVPGVSLDIAFKIASAFDISLAEFVSSPEELFDKNQVELPQSLEDLRECMSAKLRMLMHSRSETNTCRKLTRVSKINERVILRVLGKEISFVPTLSSLAGIADFFQVPISSFFIPNESLSAVDDPYGSSKGFDFQILKTRLRVSRTEAGITISQMAGHLGLNTYTVSVWEDLDKPKRFPKMEVLGAWAEHTNKPLQWFFTPVATSPANSITSDSTLQRLSEEKRWFLNQIISLLLEHEVPADALDGTLRVLGCFPRLPDNTGAKGVAES